MNPQEKSTRLLLMDVIDEFLNGDSSQNKARKIEGLICETYSDNEELMDVADMLAQYSPIAAPGLLTFQEVHGALERARQYLLDQQD